ncbi:MAG TPA: hypothetical protein VFI32_11450 [Rhodanobacteraceae bacterium]|nr:hypothetical protein [Rhodanobacteraceae bacterium]
MPASGKSFPHLAMRPRASFASILVHPRSFGTSKGASALAFRRFVHAPFAFAKGLACSLLYTTRRDWAAERQASIRTELIEWVQLAGNGNAGSDEERAPRTLTIIEPTLPEHGPAHARPLTSRSRWRPALSAFQSWFF